MIIRNGSAVLVENVRRWLFRFYLLSSMLPFLSISLWDSARYRKRSISKRPTNQLVLACVPSECRLTNFIYSRLCHLPFLSISLRDSVRYSKILYQKNRYTPNQPICSCLCPIKTECRLTNFPVCVRKSTCTTYVYIICFRCLFLEHKFISFASYSTHLRV